MCYACTAGKLITRLDTPAAVSASPVFAAQQRHAYVATLGGHVQAFSMLAACTAEGRHNRGIVHMWQHDAAAPIFSTPVVSAAEGLLVYAAVDGRLVALNLKGGPSLLALRGASACISVLHICNGKVMLSYPLVLSTFVPDGRRPAVRHPCLIGKLLHMADQLAYVAFCQRSNCTDSIWQPSI